MKNSKSAIAYIDSSIILRHAVGDKAALKGLERLAPAAATSVFTRIECFRVLDRWRVTREVPEERVALAWQITHEFLRALKSIPIGSAVIELAGQSFPIALKSLDAIHLASAMLLKHKGYTKITMITHDLKLGMAARAMDLEIAGV